MAGRISYYRAAVALGSSDQVVLSQSTCIVCADQVLGQDYCRSNIIVLLGRREFPQKLLSVALNYPSYLRRVENHCVRTVNWKWYNESSAWVWCESWEDKLCQRRVIQCADDLKVTVLYQSQKYCRVEYFSGEARESRLMVKSTLIPTWAKHKQTDSLLPSTQWANASFS